MTKILCTLILLFLGQSVFSSQIDPSNLSEGNENFLSLGQAEEIAAGSQVQSAAGLQKDLHKLKIFLIADFSSFCRSSRSAEKLSGEIRGIISNLSTAKVLYPFHSFP